MTFYDAAVYASVALIIVAIVVISKRFSLRQRIDVGSVLLFFSLAVIFGGLALSDRPFLQSEAVALIWMGSSAFLLVLSIVLIVPAAMEVVRLKRGSRKRL
jgi:hypothetical protein